MQIKFLNQLLSMTIASSIISSIALTVNTAFASGAIYNEGNNQSNNYSEQQYRGRVRSIYSNNRSTNEITNRVTNRSTNGSTNRITNRFTNRVTNRFTNRVTNRSTNNQNPTSTDGSTINNTPDIQSSTQNQLNNTAIDEQISILISKFVNSKKIEEEKYNLLADMYNKLLDPNTSKETIQKILETIKELLTNPNVSIYDKYMIAIDLGGVILRISEKFKSEKAANPEATLNTELLNAITDTIIDVIKKLSTKDTDSTEVKTNNDLLRYFLSKQLSFILMFIENNDSELQNKILETINSLKNSDEKDFGKFILDILSINSVNQNVRDKAKAMLENY